MEVDPPFRGLLSKQIVGASNGLMCVFDSNGFGLNYYFLVNPITRKFRKIPRVSLPPEFHPKVKAYNDLDKVYWEFNRVRACGFGYDEVNDDFKMVTIAELNVQLPFFVMVYSLKSNAWTQIHDVPSHIRFRPSSHLVVL